MGVQGLLPLANVPILGTTPRGKTRLDSVVLILNREIIPGMKFFLLIYLMIYIFVDIGGDESE